MTEFDLV